MAWRTAKSLLKLRNQVNKAYPNRNKASDGTIGDQAHSSRVSQHNPNSAGVVTALDITHDPKSGADMNKLKEKIIKDSRIWYVIFNRRIWQKNTGWQNYTGSNPHTKHLHISVKQTASQYDDSKNWNISAKVEDMKTTRKDSILLRKIAEYKNVPSEQEKRKWTDRDLTKLLEAIVKQPFYKNNKEKLQKYPELVAENKKLKEQLKNSDITSNDAQVKQSLRDKIIKFIKGA